MGHPRPYLHTSNVAGESLPEVATSANIRSWLRARRTHTSNARSNAVTCSRLRQQHATCPSQAYASAKLADRLLAVQTHPCARSRAARTVPRYARCWPRCTSVAQPNRLSPASAASASIPRPAPAERCAPRPFGRRSEAHVGVASPSRVALLSRAAIASCTPTST